MHRSVPFGVILFCIIAVFPMAKVQASTSAGEQAYRQGDYAKALREFTKEGSPRAWYYLGVMYHNGEGVRRDRDRAAKWTRMAADQGIVEAQVNLGAMYYGGEGVRKDRIEAIKWFRKAAQQGDGKARRNLKALLEPGNGNNDRSASQQTSRREIGTEKAQLSRLGRNSHDREEEAVD